MEHEASFGQWLKQQRKARDLTQEELGALIGCAAGTIRKIEAEKLRPSKPIVEALADTLNIAPPARAEFVRWARGRNDSPSGSPVPEPVARLRLSSTYLPAPLTSLIGRVQEIATLRRQLLHDGVRLMTLTGPPGVGKTRLSLVVALELQPAFADGVAFVALASIRDPRLVPSMIAQTLGIVEIAGQPILETLKDALEDRRLLLVLDNFEHVLDGAPLVADLLQAAPRLTALVTSRALPHLYGEHEVVVRPLALPDFDHQTTTVRPTEQLARSDAVRLFVERARAAVNAFALDDENAAVVAEICRRLDGLPLAIDLAAARSKHLAPQALLSQVSRRLELLTNGARLAATPADSAQRDRLEL